MSLKVVIHHFFHHFSSLFSWDWTSSTLLSHTIRHSFCRQEGDCRLRFPVAILLQSLVLVQNSVFTLQFSIREKKSLTIFLDKTDNQSDLHPSSPCTSTLQCIFSEAYFTTAQELFSRRKSRRSNIDCKQHGQEESQRIALLVHVFATSCPRCSYLLGLPSLTPFPERISCISHSIFFHLVCLSHFLLDHFLILLFWDQRSDWYLMRDEGYKERVFDKVKVSDWRREESKAVLRTRHFRHKENKETVLSWKICRFHSWVFVRGLSCYVDVVVSSRVVLFEGLLSSSLHHFLIQEASCCRTRSRQRIFLVNAFFPRGYSNDCVFSTRTVTTSSSSLPPFTLWSFKISLHVSLTFSSSAFYVESLLWNWWWPFFVLHLPCWSENLTIVRCWSLDIQCLPWCLYFNASLLWCGSDIIIKESEWTSPSFWRTN